MDKVCTKCGIKKDLTEFYQRKKHRTGEYYERCKECFKSRGKQYYYQNHDRQLHLANIRKQRYREERIDWLEKLKNKPCTECHQTYPPYIMDFDHIDGKSKISSISKLALRDTSNFEKIKHEIEKCDLVCANCHRQRTHDRIQKIKKAAVAKLVKALV